MKIRLPLSGLVAVTAGLYLLTVALVAVSWWLAQRMAWYVYAPVMAIAPFLGPTVQMFRTARAEYRAKSAPGCGEHCLYCCPCAQCTRDRERLVK